MNNVLLYDTYNFREGSFVLVNNWTISLGIRLRHSLSSNIIIFDVNSLENNIIHPVSELILKYYTLFLIKKK